MSNDDTRAQLLAALGDAAHALAIHIDEPAYIIRYGHLKPVMIVSVMPGDAVGDPTDQALIDVICVHFSLTPADALHRLLRFGMGQGPDFPDTITTH